MTDKQIEAIKRIIWDFEDVYTEEGADSDKVSKIENDLKEWFCNVTGHDYNYDMCGYWQHKHCMNCGTPQYPDLNEKSCGELSAEMGKTTEEEYSESKEVPSMVDLEV